MGGVVIADESSSINIVNSDLSGRIRNGDFAAGVLSQRGSIVNARGVNARMTTTNFHQDFHIYGGSTIYLENSIGGVNKTINTINADGIIYSK